MSDSGETPLGVVLAGGKSSRMGRDKARLTFFGQPLLCRAVEVLAQVTGEVLVSGRDPAPFGLKAPWLPDDPPELGPAGGVLTVLDAVRRSCLVVSCDLPFLDASILSRLVAAWRRRPAGAVMTTFRMVETGFMEPLVAVYDPPGIGLLRRNLAMGQRRLSVVFPENLRWHVDYSKKDRTVARAFFNVNSQPDLILARGMEEPIDRRRRETS